MARIIKQSELPAHLAELEGHHTMAEAAHILSRDPSIAVGRDQLFDAMAAEEWIFRGRDGRWIAYAESVHLGYLVLHDGGEYVSGTGQIKERPKQIYVTPKGIGEMHHRLGGSQQLTLT